MDAFTKWMVFPFLLVFVSLCSYCKSLDFTLVYHIDEGQRSESHIGTVITHKNISINASLVDVSTLQYAFLTQNGPHSSLFKIDSVSSELTTLKILDRETLCKSVLICQYIVEIAAKSSNGYFDIFKVLIIIDDVNDNAPEFSPQNGMQIDIEESDNTGAVLSLVHVKDSDIGKNCELSFQIFPDEQTFEIRATQNPDRSSVLSLIVNEKLDRETKNFYRLLIVATDNGEPQLFSNFTVNITITDVNDNRPAFTETLHDITVKENVSENAVILKLTATDPDKDAYGRVSYVFSSDTDESSRNLFTVDENDGGIRVIGNINPTHGKPYVLLVDARDGGTPPLMSQARVNVNVLDTDNKAPEIAINLLTSNTDTVEVSEAVQVGYFVAHIRVTDKDSGENGKVVCRIISDEFQLKPLSAKDYKVVVASLLDREEKSEHSITISCQDRGSPPMYSSANFRVHLLDENDNAPHFTRSKYIVRISENNQFGAVLAQVAASDLDTGPNGVVNYRLQNTANTLVKIQPTTGVVLANVQFDRETLSSVVFYVLATDQGTTPKTATATIILTIEDKNDNRPYISEDSRVFNVLENQKPGTIIGTIVGKDKDVGSNGQVMYSLASNYRPNELFEISADGVLKTRTILVQGRHVVRVLLSDKGMTPLTSTGDVEVYAVNKNNDAPVIIFPSKNNSTFYIAYFESPGTAIFTVKAKSLIGSDDEKFHFSIVNDNRNNIFRISSFDGVVTLGKDLSKNEIGKYMLNIIVKDNEKSIQSSSIKITIYVGASNSSMEFNVIGADESQQNIAIVATVAVVTIVLSIAIIVTIVIVKRVDKKKHNYCTSAAARRRESESETSDQLPDTDPFDEKPKKSKKEVSFSLQDDADSPTNPTSYAPVNLQSRPASEIPFVDALSMQLEHSLDGSTQNSQLPHYQDSWTNNNQQVNRLTTQKLQQALLQTQEKAWPHQTQVRGSFRIMKKIEDSQSEESTEMVASDSGHGGSEDDVQPHNHDTGVTQNGGYLSTFAAPRNDCHPAPSKPQRNNLQRSSQRNSVRFSDRPAYRYTDNQTSTTSVPSFINHQQSDFYQQEPQNNPYSARNPTPTNEYPSHYVPTQQSTMPQQYYPANSPLYPQISGVRYSGHADHMDYDDDNASTTTSGSYAVSCEGAAKNFSFLNSSNMIV